MRRFLISAIAAGVLASAIVGGTATLGSSSAAAQAPAVSTPAVSAAVATEATKAAKSTATTPAMYTYGPHGGERNTLDVYTPTKAVGKTGKNLPTVVLVHGGSWIMGTRSTLAAESKQFAALGYVAISVDYRPATDAAWPAQRTDLRRALGWVSDNASKLNVDDDRIVVLGSSAGAEIAVSALTRAHGSDLARGVVSLSAPLDKKMVVDRAGRATNAKRLADVVTGSLLGCLPADCPEKYKASSPKTWVDKTGRPDAALHLVQKSG